jgi:GH25 family lysozyme M1 (1,4-beta-N-acetylmuramidase)
VSGAVRGVDVSSWQHPGQAEIDWHEVVDAGYSFAMVKATQGTNYVNNWLSRDLDDARAAGLLVGAYHYLEVNVSPQDQAGHFIGSLIGQVLEMGVWLDFEPGAVQAGTAQMALTGFLTEVDKTRPGCGLYCDLAWLETLKAAYISIPRLWLADWAPTEPHHGQLLWQEGQKEVKGIAGPVDVDVCDNVRALNIPTAPKPKPTAATTLPARPKLDEETVTQGPDDVP